MACIGRLWGQWRRKAGTGPHTLYSCNLHTLDPSNPQHRSAPLRLCIPTMDPRYSRTHDTHASPPSPHMVHPLTQTHTSSLVHQETERHTNERISTRQTCRPTECITHHTPSWTQQPMHRKTHHLGPQVTQCLTLTYQSMKYNRPQMCRPAIPMTHPPMAT